MTAGAPAVPTRRSGLLVRATSYARRIVGQVERADLARPSPCDRWDLRDLMRHLNESVATLREAVDHGCVFPEPAPAGPSDAEVLHTFDVQTRLLLAAWDERHGDRPVAVGPDPVCGTVLADIGAVEIAVHGWDVAQACDLDADFPAGLADDLLAVARWAVPRPRFPQFAPEIPACGPEAGDRLVAFLGRRPLRAVDDAQATPGNFPGSRQAVS
jgi:uncharacterized protein (TIGR03086 family)